MRFLHPHLSSARSHGSLRKKSCAGLTLVEVVIASAILAFGLASAAICIQISTRNLDVARASTLAAQVMQNEMERLRMMDWDTLSGLPASANVNVNQTFAGATTLQTPITLNRTISDVDGFDGMKEIILTAHWTSRTDGRAHTRTYRMRYAKGGLHDYYYSSNASI